MNPFLPLIAAHLVAISTWPFLSAQSPYRAVVLATVVVCCTVSFQSIDKNTWWGVDFAEYVFGFAIYISYFFCLRKLVIPNGYSLPERFKMAATVLFSSRIDVPAQSLPPFRSGDAQYVPSRREFLLKRSWTFAWTISAFSLLHAYPLILWPDDFESPKHHLLRRLPDVSAREWIITLHMSFCSWFQPYYLFTATHSLASVIAVVYGDSPANWRPLFGNLGEAYTVQRFHGIFWHKLMRRSFTGHASYIVSNILGLPRVSSITRCAIVFISFLISGIMHALVSPMPLSCAGPRVMLFYCGLAGVVILESMITRLCQRYNSRMEKNGLIPYFQFAGYIWVGLFHVWTTPKVVYPSVVCVQQLAMARLLDEDAL